MVLGAGKKAAELGGHIATFASAATLYEVGFNHFFRADTEKSGGDLFIFKGIHLLVYTPEHFWKVD